VRSRTKRSVVVTLVLLVLIGMLGPVGLAGVSWAKDDPKLREAIEAANGQFVAATARGDAAALAALYSESGQLLPPGGETLTGREALKTFWQGALDSGMKAVKVEMIELTGAGDFAFELGRYWMYGADGHLTEAGKDVVVWKREHGSWRMSRDIWNSNQPPVAH
jgi:uncharacterized protein (TIGR02246 family)